MASDTKKTMRKRQMRLKNAGRVRKAKQGRKSTATYAELFAACGEPGKPATKA